ncbi:cytochrome P450 1A2-like [Haliotis rufescens]|uniref:cytochrome P450 1A2-like n=1 Tax=Haliotis rufescens TaxID=6454 RepID=UPI00201F3F4B|nr:cytochrome P450 1A2-like [Haliotis rufescens]
MVFTTLTFLASALMIVYLLFKSWTNKASKPLPPGPRGVAALLTFLKAARNTTVHFYSETWAKQYGDIVSITLFNRTLCFVNEVKLAKQLLCDNGYKAYTNDRPKSFVSSFIFKGRSLAFSPAGMHHTTMRKTFHNSLRLYGDGIQAFEDTIMDELQNLVVEMNSQPEFQLEEVIGTSLLNVIYILLTDKRPNDGGNTVRAMIANNDIINEMASLEIDQSLTSMPFLRHVPGPFKTTCDRAHSRTEHLLHVVFDAMKESYIPGRSKGLIHAAMESNMADEDIRLLILEIIAAGYLSTKGSLIGIILAFIEQPEMQEKLYDQIKVTVGDRRVKVEDKVHLPYVDAVILESIRYLSHGTHGVPHMATKELEVNGYRIPNQAIILINLWYLNHNESLWHDPWVFRPERFLDDQGQLLAPEHPIRKQFLAFGIGKRQCPGEVFAKTRLFLFITTLVQHFKILPPEGGMTSSSDPRTWSPGIILQPLPTGCRVVRRETCPLL